MKFPYFVKQPPPDLVRQIPTLRPILKPLIRVALRYKGKKHTLLALIDSGADACLFPRDVADLLGIDVRAGKRQNFTGIGDNNVVPFYFHEVEILIDKYQIKTEAGFSTKSIGESGNLGQRGFFDQFTIVFDRPNKVIEIKKPGLFQALSARLAF